MAGFPAILSLNSPRTPRNNGALIGAIAQMGERLHGMQEVGGSIPPGSTNTPIVFRYILEWVTR